MVGGPIGDRIGRKPVIWVSILGVAPFALLLPHADLFWTTTLTIVIGLMLSSAFSAILVYAQELMPGKVGMVSGLFFGFAFGMGGLRRRGAGPARRPHQHRLRLRRHRLPAIAGRGRRTSAQERSARLNRLEAGAGRVHTARTVTFKSLGK